MKNSLLLILLTLIGGSSYGQTQEDFDQWPRQIVDSVYPNSTSAINISNGTIGQRDEPIWLGVLGIQNDSLPVWNREIILNELHIDSVALVLRLVDTQPIHIRKSRISGIGTDFSEFSSLELLNDTVSNFIEELSKFGQLLFENDTIAQVWLSGIHANVTRLDSVRINELTIGPYVDSSLEDLDISAERFGRLAPAEVDTLISDHSKYGTLKLNITSRQISFNSDSVSGLVKLEHIQTSLLTFNNCSLGQLDISNCHIRDNLSLSHSYLSKSSSISGILSGPLNLQGLKLGDGAILDLGSLYDTLPNGNRKLIPINLFDVKVEKLNLDWSSFCLSYSDRDKTEAVNGVYQALMEDFKRRGQTESFNLLDREFQRFRYRHYRVAWLGSIWDRIVWAWWDYGHGGWQVIIWTLLLPFLWALFIPYRKMIGMHENVYPVDNLQPILNIPHRNKWWKKYLRKLTYVAVVFYALSIKFEKLHYRRGGLIVLFVLIYLNGIFCLFFIANYLLKG